VYLEDTEDDLLTHCLVHLFDQISSSLSSLGLPAEWKEEMDFFRELETTDTMKMSGLRAGM
jgi:hypothetical protein